MAENALMTLPWPALVKRWTSDGATTLVSAGTALLLERVTRLQKLVRSGEVVISAIHHASITPSACATLRRISGLNPWTVSWCNVVDYIDGGLRAFHAMARAASGPEDTMHYAYSMNWRLAVKGTSALDFPEPEQRKELLRTGRDAVNAIYRELGLSSLLLNPPCSNPMNIVDAALAMGMYPVWVDKFTQAARIPQHQLFVEAPCGYEPLSHCGNGHIWVTWTYDPAIRMLPK
jgi:hypothetical protein